MAYISELHYSNNYANSSSTQEFVEVTLNPGENPADFRLSLYQQGGGQGLQFSLTDPAVETFPAGGGRTVYVFDGNALNFRITAPTSNGNRNFEGIALTDTSASPNDVLNFYTLGSGGTITATNGHASGTTSTTLATNVGSTSVQIDENGNATQAPHTRGQVCFSAGTQIETPAGLRNVEDISVGDPVITADNGVQLVAWAAKRRVKGFHNLAPVTICKGTLGARRDLSISPQHRVRLTGWQAQLYFGREEVLVPAIALVNGKTIHQTPRACVTYVHIMFDQHQIITSEGVRTESFFPGRQALDLLEHDTLNELLEIFPELSEKPQEYGATALQVIRGSEALVLDLA
ncbi:Hint domain-containing protein [Halocynthiibacter sp.]|uniref:Hint domain-containing protein n=1 Tax=Halocynthiibacter sp. TaxID=1979210 RepID=UPI003C4AF91D